MKDENRKKTSSSLKSPLFATDDGPRTTADPFRQAAPSSSER